MSEEFVTETIEFCEKHAVSRRDCGCSYKLPSHVDVQEADTLAAVVDDLSDWFSSYVYTRNPHAYIVLALWVVHTHAIHEVASTPRIQITSPQPECGKTTLVEHLEHLTVIFGYFLFFFNYLLYENTTNFKFRYSIFCI